MTEVLQCNSVGTYDEYFTWPGLPKPPNVNAPDDENASGIGSYIAVSGRQSFTLTASAIPPGDVINSLTIRARSVTEAPPNDSSFRCFVRLGGVEVYGAQIWIAQVNWTDYFQALARPGGGSWQLADLATVEIGVWCDSGDWHWCTSLEATIDYSAPGPGGTGDMLLVF